MGCALDVFGTGHQVALCPVPWGVVGWQSAFSLSVRRHEKKEKKSGLMPAHTETVDAQG